MSTGQSSARAGARAIGPSRGFAWAALLAVAGLTAGTPLVEWSAFGLPSKLSTPLFTLCVTLALWRFDFAPRLAWNVYGLAVRSCWRVARVRWAEVGALTIVESGTRGDRIMVHVTDGRFEVGFDRIWWLARLSPRYADRNRRYLEELRRVRHEAQHLTEVGAPPVLLSAVPLLGTLGCWALGLAIAVSLH